jgi:uncharacterized membrane protein
VKTARNDAIDIVRGAVMVLMALDHARDFTMGFGRGGPTNLATTTVALFFTRWVTHFCAPTFVLLAGTGAGLARRSKSPPELAWFLFSRGLWLVLLELTVVRLGWMLNLNYHFVVLQVIWALGWSMVVLSAFVFSPPLVAAVFGAVLVLGHNLLDGVQATQLGQASWLWHVLHESGRLQPTSWTTVMLAYPLVPWAGVMAAGYALGCLLPEEAAARRRLLLRLGTGLTLAFLIVRGLNGYGDPRPWTPQPRGAVYTVLSFLNCEKYPPSLEYLLMTLGPALLAIAALELRPVGRLSQWLRTFGRVPLFFYLIHLFVLHAVTIAFALPRLVGDPAFRTRFMSEGELDWGLGGTYLVWAVAVIALYLPCRWYAGVKRRSRSRLLSYL